MICEILCVGTELLLGEIVNTDGAFIAREMAAMGFPPITRRRSATIRNG
ncbi:MAG: hypothetical protein J6Q17_09115 [Clostridia bacterium]|nr:hypothetical protein [Clostridia bacterium]